LAHWRKKIEEELANPVLVEKTHTHLFLGEYNQSISRPEVVAGDQTWAFF